jgi:predicted enzyme involved in methoxymalonyl-ACP biosynthesis
MSCRVMGKKVEDALLGYTLARARDGGATCVTVPAVEGPRNAPARDFFATRYMNTDRAAIDPARMGFLSFVRLKEES